MAYDQKSYQLLTNFCDLLGADVTLTSSHPLWAMACPLIIHKCLSLVDYVLIQHESRNPSPCQMVDRWCKGDSIENDQTGR